MAIGYWLLWLVGAYGVGSIPFAVILGRARGVDIRQVGSGNPGATNLGRTVGKKWGLLCFVLDMGKGMLPTLGFGLTLMAMRIAVFDEAGLDNARVLDDAESAVGDSVLWAAQWVLVAIAAVCGHVFSPFLGFKGGKGVATGLGAALGLFPFVTLPGLIALGLWYLTAKLSGYVGLASVVAAASLPPLTVVSALILGGTIAQMLVFAGLTALLTLLVIARHKDNLIRTMRGTETKAAWTGRAR